MVIIESDGKKFEFRGEYRVPDKGDYFLISGGTALNGAVMRAESRNSNLGSRAIVHLIPEILEFGGIKFVKTGEVRYPVSGEWYLSEMTNGPGFRTDPSKTLFTAAILKPVDVTQTEPVKETNIDSLYYPKCSWNKRECGCKVNNEPPPHSHTFFVGQCSCGLWEGERKKYSIQFSEKTVKEIARLGYGNIFHDAFGKSSIEAEIIEACKKALGQ